jgi:hypothetical protein
MASNEVNIHFFLDDPEDPVLIALPSVSAFQEKTEEAVTNAPYWSPFHGGWTQKQVEDRVYTPNGWRVSVKSSGF